MNHQFQIKKNFLQKNKWIILLILIPMFFSVFLRLQVLDLSKVDEVAQQEVESLGKNNLLQKIKQENPEMPSSKILELVEEQFEKFKIDNKEQLTNLINEESTAIKSKLKDSSDHVYLMPIDPYFYARHIRNLIENGHIGDELKDGRPFNTHQLAPTGKFSKPNLHMWIGTYVYKIVHLYNPVIPLTTVLFYIPVIISALAVIPAFFIGKKLHNNTAGFFSALLIAIHPYILSRTFGGFGDTDCYNILMPLVLVLCFVYLSFQKNLRWILFFNLLLGLFFGIYSALWSGWTYIFYIIVGTFFLTLIYNLIIFLSQNTFPKSSNTKNVIVNLFLSTFFGILGFLTFRFFLRGSFFADDPLKKLVFSPFDFIFMKTQTIASTNFWPNVLSTVKELQEATPYVIIQRSGGYILFILFLIGLIILLIRLYKTKKILLFFFFILWNLAVIYGLTKGLRFILVFGVLFSLILGYGFAILIEFLAKKVEDNWKFSKNAIYPIITCLLIGCLFFGIPFISESIFFQSLEIAKNPTPLMNDAWWFILEYIKDNTKEDAIITSWWDYGHWFKFVADRPVTFDGASQNQPQAYWVGKFFLANNEKEAVGILRMLDCDGNNAFDKLYNYTNNNFLTSINILSQALTFDRANAKTHYGQFLTEAQTNSVLDSSHCINPPEAVVIVSEDMVSKAGVWAHFGGWNFTRAEMLNQAKRGKEFFTEFAQNRLDLDKNEISKLYRKINFFNEKESEEWISSWPKYKSAQLKSCIKKNKQILCQDNLIIDLPDYKVQRVAQGNIKIPRSIIYLDNLGNIVEKEFKDYTEKDSSVILIPLNKDLYAYQLSNKVLATSLFSKLFYFNDFDLKHFTKFQEIKTVAGDKIITYKVDWEDKNGS